MKINPTCIRKSLFFVFKIKYILFDFSDALATTIKNCISQLNDLSEVTARFYCGYTLMKHCAVNVGLERFRLNFQIFSPVND